VVVSPDGRADRKQIAGPALAPLPGDNDGSDVSDMIDSAAKVMRIAP